VGYGSSRSYRKICVEFLPEAELHALAQGE
jgi:hypothetical protein